MEDRVAFVKEMHLLKTDLFMNLIEQGQLPLRPGVTRIISMFPTPCCLILGLSCIVQEDCLVPSDSMNVKQFAAALFVLAHMIHCSMTTTAA